MESNDDDDVDKDDDDNDDDDDDDYDGDDDDDNVCNVGSMCGPDYKSLLSLLATFAFCPPANAH